MGRGVFIDVTPGIGTETITKTYNGMTIMRIGTPSEFIQEESGTYIKGRLIRTTIKDDSHLISEINAELNQGVYL